MVLFWTPDSGSSLAGWFRENLDVPNLNSLMLTAGPAPHPAPKTKRPRSEGTTSRHSFCIQAISTSLHPKTQIPGPGLMPYSAAVRSEAASACAARSPCFSLFCKELQILSLSGPHTTRIAHRVLFFPPQLFCDALGSSGGQTPNPKASVTSAC